MIHTEDHLKLVFDNLKDGDIVGFYHNIWYYLGSKLIGFSTNGKLDHVGQVCNVRRTENAVYFKLGEQKLVSGKKTTEYSIVKDGEAYYIDSRYRKKKLKVYYAELIPVLDDKQKKELYKIWQEKAEYSLWTLPLALNNVYRLVVLIRAILNLFFKLFGVKYRFSKKIKVANFCSAAVKDALDRINIRPTKSSDEVPSPVELLMYSYVKSIVLIDTNPLPKTANTTQQKKKKEEKHPAIKRRDYIIVFLLLCVIGALIYPYKVYKTICKETLTVGEIMQDATNKCMQGYYVSWVRFGGGGLAQHYQFQDVLSYNNIDKEPYSLKAQDINNLYNNDDLMTSLGLYAMLTHSPSAQGIFLQKAQIQELREKYKDIDFLLGNINKNIENAAYSVVYDYNSNTLAKRISDIFIITQEEGFTECNRQEMVKIVENLTLIIATKQLKELQSSE